MSDNSFVIVYNTLEKKYNKAQQKDLQNITINPQKSNNKIKDLLEITLSSMEETFEDLLKKADAPQEYQKYTSIKFYGLDKIITLPIEIRELQEEGYTKYQARIIAFGQTIVSDIVTSIATAAAGAAALYFGAPTVVAVVATVGTQYAAGQLYEATGGKTFVTNSLVDFSEFVAKEIPGTPFDAFYNLDNKANITLSSEFAKVVNAYSEYLVIPTTKGGYSVALNEKDKAIFLNEKPIQTVSYWDVKGDKGVNVNLEDGTVFPAVDPFRKALIGNNSVYYTYEYYGTDGTRYGLYYDEKGDENYDNYLGNRQKASTSSEQIMPLSAKNIDNTANTDAIKNSFQELNTYYNYNGSTNFWSTMIENIEPPNQVFNANTTKLI
ncbi:MAG: hypothetical protein KME64_17530 [Scytonematopsis contorta HA4267-MV1]|jgi:hypothetical protein|nr:hypothetical protein [Scytonematopsis contorta HA4267-MV1]